MQPLLRLAVRHLVAQGYAAWVRECTKHIETGPSEYLDELGIPFHWLIGDKTPTFSRSNCESAKGANENVSAEIVPNAGSLLAYQRPDVFTRCMSDLASPDPKMKFRIADLELAT